MYPILIALCLVAAIGMYFYNNPMNHSRWFLIRRFINWFPLGMTYAFLYMGRYNLNVSKNALGAMMSKQDFGLIFAAGTITYAFSFLVNGPLVDKIGGKRGIIIAALGSSLANIFMGVLTYLMVTGRLKVNMVVAFSAIYSINMYFQSYGAVSIIKVKAYWFHVRERGVFGAIFGTLISVGAYFAFDWGQAIVEMTKANPQGQMGWFHAIIQHTFAMKTNPVDATWAVFYIPAAILVVWVLLDWWLIKDTPEEANFPSFDTHDASSGFMHVKFTSLDLLKRVFTSPLMLMIAVVEMTSGVFRNGIMQWYTIFAHDVKQPGAEFFLQHWGFLICVFGIVGGFRRRPGFGQAVPITQRSALRAALRFCVGHGGVDAGVSLYVADDRRFRRAADCHGRHRHHIVDVRHSRNGFWRSNSDRDLLGHRGRIRLPGKRLAVVQPRLSHDVELALVAGVPRALRTHWRIHRAQDLERTPRSHPEVHCRSRAHPRPRARIGCLLIASL